MSLDFTPSQRRMVGRSLYSSLGGSGTREGFIESLAKNYKPEAVATLNSDEMFGMYTEARDDVMKQIRSLPPREFFLQNMDLVPESSRSQLFNPEAADDGLQSEGSKIYRHLTGSDDFWNLQSIREISRIADPEVLRNMNGAAFYQAINRSVRYYSPQNSAGWSFVPAVLAATANAPGDFKLDRDSIRLMSAVAAVQFFDGFDPRSGPSPGQAERMLRVLSVFDPNAQGESGTVNGVGVSKVISALPAGRLAHIEGMIEKMLPLSAGVGARSQLIKGMTAALIIMEMQSVAASDALASTEPKELGDGDNADDLFAARVAARLGLTFERKNYYSDAGHIRWGGFWSTSASGIPDLVSRAVVFASSVGDASAGPDEQSIENTSRIFRPSNQFTGRSAQSHSVFLNPFFVQQMNLGNAAPREVSRAFREAMQGLTYEGFSAVFPAIRSSGINEQLFGRSYDAPGPVTYLVRRTNNDGTVERFFGAGPLFRLDVPFGSTQEGAIVNESLRELEQRNKELNPGGMGFDNRANTLKGHLITWAQVERDGRFYMTPMITVRGADGNPLTESLLVARRVNGRMVEAEVLLDAKATENMLYAHMHPRSTTFSGPKIR